MTDRFAILKLYIDVVKQNKDYTVAGLEKAFKTFADSLNQKTITPPPRNLEPGDYVRTTLADAAKAANKPIVIPTFVNKFGNIESRHIQGLIFQKDENDNVFAIGVQDGPNIMPLSMHYVRLCMTNGYRYKQSNTVGSAQSATNELQVN